MTLLLADLRDPEDVDAIRQRLLTNLAGAGAPIDDWLPAASGGVEMIRVDADATALQRLLATRVALLANLMLLELAEGDPLTLYAQKRYGIVRDESTRTIQNIALWLVGSAGAQSFAPGDLIVSSDATGNRYRLIEDIQIDTSNTAVNPLFARFEAEQPGSSYADAAETVTTLVTAVGGLRCSNRRPSEFLPTKVTGVSTGKVTAIYEVPGTPPPYESIRVRITASGEIGTATFDYSINGGAFWFTGAVTQAIYGLGGALILFANGAPGSSFIVGDIFTLLVAEAIAQQGADEESDTSLRNRCRLRWMTLSDVPLEGTINLWAHLASPEVDKVMADADPNTPGSILVTLASASGTASAAAVLAVQDYISERLFGYRGMPAPTGFFSPEEKVLVRSATVRTILPAGVVQAPRATITAVQQAAETAWLAYLRSVPLGGQPGAAVVLTELIQAVMDAGAVDFLGATLNGAAANVTLADREVAVPPDGSTLLTALTWQPV